MTNPGEKDIHRMALEALPLGVYAVNREGKVILWSAGAEKLTDYLRQDVLGRLHESDLLKSGEEDQKTAQDSAEPRGDTLQAASSTDAPLSVRCKNGRYLKVQVRSVPLRDEAGEFVATVKVFEANSPSHCSYRRRGKLGAYGCLDALTGALNHSMIQARLKECLNLYALYPVPFCVMCYGIDDLSKLGDRYGQAAVDAVLRMVADTFESGLRPTDFLGRWLDQEFLAILPECGESDVMRVAERLRKLVRHAGVEWWGDTLHATVSIGATIGHDSDTVSTVVGRAEQALRESSSMGGNRVVMISA
jgi:diguanylate cyclase (GGDEF)-like protein/PAS domain S-box-containing protein